MTERSSSSSSGGCGCGGVIISILLLWALWFGLKTPWGTYNIDIFPPQVRQVAP